MKLIIFDCDGVLIDSEPVIERLMSEDLHARGLPIAPRACRDLFVGGTMASAMEEARRLGAVLPEDWVSRMNGRVANVLAEGVSLIEGITALIDAIEAAGVATAIASNGPQAKMRASLGASGLWDRFAGRIHSAHDEGRPKPDPHMLLVAAERAGVAPSECAMIDDNPSGLRAAQDAGMMAIGYCGAEPPERLAPFAHHVVHRMADIAELIGLGN